MAQKSSAEKVERWLYNHPKATEEKFDKWLSKRPAEAAYVASVNAQAAAAAAAVEPEPEPAPLFDYEPVNFSAAADSPPATPTSTDPTPETGWTLPAWLLPVGIALAVLLWFVGKKKR